MFANYGSPTPVYPMVDPAALAGAARISSFGLYGRHRYPSPMPSPDRISGSNAPDWPRSGISAAQLPVVANLPTTAPAPQASGAPAAAPSGSTPAASAPTGMFGAQPRHGLNIGGMIAAALAGFEDGYNGFRTNLSGNVLNTLEERRKEALDADAQRQYMAALVAKGVDPQTALIMSADPSEMAKHLGTRFDTQNVRDGSSVYTPNLNGSANIYTAPKTFQRGADVVQMPGSQTAAPDYSTLGAIGTPQPLGAPTPIPGLRTDAVQYADSVAQRGSQEWNQAVQDYALKGYGPTAVGMLGQRLATDRTIAAGHDATSAANNVRTTQASIGNNARTTATNAANNTRTVEQSNVNSQRAADTARGSYIYQHGGSHGRFGTLGGLGNAPVAVGPGGHTITLRNGQWVDAQTGQPVR